MQTQKLNRKLLAVDCCEHILEALEKALQSTPLAISSRDRLGAEIDNSAVDLIVVGAPEMPIRRLFIGRLRRFYPETPILILRREKVDVATSDEWLRGEFILSDVEETTDLEVVKNVRGVLPMGICEHVQENVTFELLREVTRVLAENYSDSSLDLEQVADELSISPSRLSTLLNKKVHISFRQMLRHIRIEEAKRLLASQRFSVKEVASRVGFSDSHYFSRIFKEMTGKNPTEFSYGSQELILT